MKMIDYMNTQLVLRNLHCMNTQLVLQNLHFHGSVATKPSFTNLHLVYYLHRFMLKAYRFHAIEI